MKGNNRIKGNHLYHALLLSVVLLMIQYGAIIHSVKHPFHADDVSCEVYLAAKHLSNGLVATIIALGVLTAESLYFPLIFPHFYGQTPTYFQARAPPFLLHRY